MRIMTFTAILSTLLPTLALAATSTDSVLDAQALREECSAFSQAGMQDCLKEKVESSQMTLSNAEAKASDLLSKWDEDDKYVIQAKTTLAASHKEFVEYRKTQCEFSASLSGGGAGNAHEAGRLACIAELNNRRAKLLLDAVSNLPLK